MSDSQSSIADEIVAAHNQYRSGVEVSDIEWSGDLANEAQEWADHLTSIGQLEHSHTDGEGENLSMGSTGGYSVTDFVNGWGEEKKYFVGGTFPNVSSTGNWQDVGHYTQVVWRDTTQVGCAVASDGSNDYLVCRYTPPGNFDGQSPF